MTSIPLLLIVTVCVMLPPAVTAQTPVLLRTFNNPTPEAGEFFVGGMAALGNDRVLIETPNYKYQPAARSALLRTIKTVNRFSL